MYMYLEMSQLRSKQSCMCPSFTFVCTCMTDVGKSCVCTSIIVYVCCTILQTNRFRIYLASLCSDAVVDFNAPLPSGLIPSPSVSTLHNPDHASGETDFLEEFHRHGHMSHIMGTPPVSRGGGALRELQRHSPVLSRKPNFK